MENQGLLATAFLGLATAFLGLGATAFAIVRLTPTKSDDAFFDKYVKPIVDFVRGRHPDA